MGLTPFNASPKVLVNDALVVLCLRDMEDRMTHHQFRQRAKALGFPLTLAQGHNMLHRCIGYVYVIHDTEYLHWWKLKATGLEYRRYIVECISTLRLSGGIITALVEKANAQPT